jgi:hypothetical protein
LKGLFLRRILLLLAVLLVLPSESFAENLDKNRANRQQNLSPHYNGKGGGNTGNQGTNSPTKDKNSGKEGQGNPQQ